VVPKVATPSVDSLMRAAVKPGRDADADQITARGGLLTSAQREDASVTPPVLITAPTLRFPEELRAHHVEGEVVVQLRVDEKGRVDPSSMKVMHSEHELFTATVRNALPRFRFEPARSAAPESKPQAAWVQFRAQFTARN
jgi:TonB family protein